MPTTIAIADDHELFAQVLSDFIHKFEGYQVIYIADNGRSLIQKLKEQSVPDILLLDISMPEMDGFETAAYLQENHPDLKILTLSMMDKDEHITRMVRYGVRGYLLKGCKPSELRQALDDISTKGFYYSEFLTRYLLKSMRAPEKTAPAVSVRLNGREQEFLQLACSDLRYEDIADKMCVSTRTVDGYRESLFQKLNVKSRVGMVLEGLRLGLIHL